MGAPAIALHAKTLCQENGPAPAPSKKPGLACHQNTINDSLIVFYKKQPHKVNGSGCHTVAVSCVCYPLLCDIQGVHSFLGHKYFLVASWVPGAESKLSTCTRC